ncbi:MAG: GDP-L-fucose synthase [Gammaproteobacteria bacterium]|nr:GDP-L-fucose synthase [Gammaproteobacteria bacterium]
MKPDSRIYVAGHRGLVGAALVRRLQAEGFENLILATSSEVDLRNQAEVQRFMAETRPEYIFLAAARVGGIHANAAYPAEFLYDNLMIESNLIEAARVEGVSKLLFLGSTCIYPRLAPQPLQEASLLSGPLEPTNEWYAVAKIAGIKLCQAYRQQYGCNFISAMPTNLYGPGDNFDLQNSHVLPALLRKFHEAKAQAAPSVAVWGSGRPRREFLHVDDCADACLYLMGHHQGEQIVNIGFGEDISIAELAVLIADLVGYQGQIQYDASRPDGTPRKLVDVSRLFDLGWRPSISLGEGIESTYRWFLTQMAAEDGSLRQGVG